MKGRTINSELLDVWATMIGERIDQAKTRYEEEDNLHKIIAYKTQYETYANCLALFSCLEQGRFKEDYERVAKTLREQDDVKYHIRDIKKGDRFHVRANKDLTLTAGEDAHQNLDEPDEPWIVYDTDGNSWFEEDIEDQEATPKRFVVICYSIHERNIASHNTFTTLEKAKSFLKHDVADTYMEELKNSGADEDQITIEVNDNSAEVTSCNREYVWTWEIIEISK